MRYLPRVTPILAIAAFLAACAPTEEAPATGEVDVDTAETAPPMARPDPETPNATVTLSLQNGQIHVDPDSIEVARGALVRWESAQGGDVWVVAFADATPFRNGRRVFNGGGRPGARQGPIDQSAQTAAYKYWVFYPDGQGGYLQLDPKLVVKEDEGTGGSDSLSSPN